jgi:hypothetical protein
MKVAIAFVAGVVAGVVGAVVVIAAEFRGPPDAFDETTDRRYRAVDPDGRRGLWSAWIPTDATLDLSDPLPGYQWEVQYRGTGGAYITIGDTTQ